MRILPDLLRARAQEDAEAVALRVGDAETLTYGEWENRSNAAARGLVAQGLRPGGVVGLRFDNHQWTHYAVAYLAALKAGAVALPLGARFAPAELERVLAHAAPSAVIAGEDLHALEARKASGAPFQMPVDDEDVAEVLYTSGTTGGPKGVACSHRDLMAHDVPPEAAGRPAASRVVSFLHAFPIGTQAGQEAMRVPLRIAGRVAIAMPSFDADELCALVSRHRVVRLQLVPATAQLLVASGAYRRHDVSSVRRIILSSAPAPPALFARLAEAFPGTSLWNAYALTEAGAARTLTEWDPARPSSVGRPVGETEVKVVDATGAPVPSGETGEVWLRRRGSPTRSYFREPEATAATFGGGWVHTGDLGHLDDEGFLHLTDRAKDVIVSGGANVSSVEVEDALYEHPAVVEAAAFGVPHRVLGEDVAAAVVVRAPTTARELQDLVRSRLAEHKVPHRIVLVERLPRTASGKVRKGELRQRFADVAPVSEPARDATEAVVASVWEAVLALPRVGVHDDFFVLGGHSLAAAQIAARLHDAFGVVLAAAAIFESPTVAELAEVLRTAAITAP